ncbi:hypothetical protein QBC37DRAFT_469498 [Rhypophila decipiens]|uniref:Uncharacterized protein n=1 Tax=Rhypophila decipiens TaxID=261697 RepID=A0AAN6YH95_9PEZI|nr:hypothetical protein QBC37DRAFT_469498 [Rhypophila decipiens]
MAEIDKSDWTHSWKIWSDTPKPKRSKRWILGRRSSPASNTKAQKQHSTTNLGNYREPSSGSFKPQSSGIETPEIYRTTSHVESSSAGIELTPLSKSSGDPGADHTDRGLVNTSPISPIASGNSQRLSGATMSRGTTSPMQTRFREELEDVPLHYKPGGSLEQKYARPPMDCSSNRDPTQSRRSPLALAFWGLSLFSTLGSFLWLIAAIYQPRWGRLISSGGHGLSPSTASLLTALLAKLIESAFVAVFVFTIGQILTKRSFDRGSTGMNLAEISMRNWVIQPGLMITDAPAVRTAAVTTLGIICLVATFAGTLYTTASDALVSPKLKFGALQWKTLQTNATASYAYLPYMRETCVTPIDEAMDGFSNDACLAVALSGGSYHNFKTFLALWHESPPAEILSGAVVMTNRPKVKSILFDNTTMTAQWIEGNYSDPSLSFQSYNRVIDNVTLAMPHPGVYTAAKDPANGILQPSELSGVGEFEIRARAVSPTVNVLCANMQRRELEPLVYSEWPNAKVNSTPVLGQKIGWLGWQQDVPVVGEHEWLNRTVVDDIFRWGPQYGRRPPVFSMYPMEFNLINNATVYASDSFYILAKSNSTRDYTLCQMRSWMSCKCSTQFNVSGTTGAHLRAHCEDDSDEASYQKHGPHMDPNQTSRDWRNLADEWNLALYLNSGLVNANASRDRILTQLILTQPKLSASLPSFAEGIAALVSSTLTAGSMDTSLVHDWPNGPNETVPIIRPPEVQSFRALIRTQEYTSSYYTDWQSVFYGVLFIVFLLNILCLFYFTATLKGRPLADFTDPPNLFALAMNSPPSDRLKGCCGGSPDRRTLGAPFGIGYSACANHYYFEERNKADLNNRWGDHNETTR